MRRRWESMNSPKTKYLAFPYIVWMIGFTVIPLALIVYYGLTDKTGAFTLENVLSIATPEHAKALFLSLALSLASTVICLLLAYPLAMILRKKGVGAGSFIVFIFILPMWMNFLLRTLAWQTLLEKSGVINGILSALGLPGISIINIKITLNYTNNSFHDRCYFIHLHHIRTHLSIHYMQSNKTSFRIIYFHI